MNIIIKFIFLLALPFQGASQNLVKDYKKVADKSLLKYLDTSIILKVKCDRFGTLSLDERSSGRHFYNADKNKRLLFSTITFNYKLFDNSLNDDLYFYITVDKNLKVIRDSSIVKNVPLCIRVSQSCSFISADSAKQIAIIDLIKYADDLSSQLERNKFDKEYYWIITGHKPSNRPKTTKPSLNVYAESISTDQRRIINARTGQIINYKQFDYDW
jgi:hypothetical protein